ncbi:hypothetical protein EMA8858_02760 [Emticicia aquatica]|jgi:hypothetical protein|uniref:Glyoxalase n=1 Tax=Emticicia aquatica TaxID=1681835 RepID=A0ABN8EVH9_9BACT|nr:glyoxalase [Emticicia aquatica]CAH0996628.1 hypothetical protein EMA8858_02760 [Emticicia aquatica]
MISAEEHFQNEFLRPILKEQNELLIAVFKNYLTKHKVLFERYSPEDQANYIENTIKKDAQLRNYFVGTIIGKLSTEQYHVFVTMETELNRRIITMLVKRLQSQMI